MTGSDVSAPNSTTAPEARLVRPSEFASGAAGNADGGLTPRPSPGRGTVSFDIPGVSVGSAEYPQGPTGCTVIHVPAGARTAVDQRGGAVGMVGGYGFNHAICLAGGSVYGLEAASGVSSALLEDVGNRTHWADLKLVTGAVIYDFSARDTAIAPDAALGRAALASAAQGAVPVGRCGAGRSASVGKVQLANERAEFSGQGAAFGTFGTAKVLLMTVVNSVGVIVDRDGRIVRGNYDSASGQRRHPVADYADAAGTADDTGAAPPAGAPNGNTTLSVMVTNVQLSDADLLQIARQVHSSMHRPIQPFHTAIDGDVLFALTTDELPLSGTTPTGLGALASDLAWDAVLSSVR